ncbi:hypothetical protein EB796_019127 [Bugula neritina]|uniref:Uncharacterized protein n=1 Tax=Bugula neritina TaxID=10212 RepID=A0A7J7JA53_BUGNE|nr:hypothetical protein EB796_019127 [Bugula neritina]
MKTSSHSESNLKAERKERDTPKDSRKKTEVSKKRKSDVLVQPIEVTPKTTKVDRQRNGSDADARAAKRAKDDLRDKERKSDKQRNSSRKTD